ncbi:hypothetical protein KJJ36_14015 [Staphylococcus pseudoxylosus]|uniref:phage tail tip lysozyme n=1 Tax=Staphylococcus pseudoxylosus TaxID=2282419 RepID=UPI001F28F46F|nr:phage tail tip lysozyme [Staphylococcus pseudoxylosus]MCE5003483.1 hypothetical protein [Staphylococcus pseudoxylosus]
MYKNILLNLIKITKISVVFAVLLSFVIFGDLDARNIANADANNIIYDAQRGCSVDESKSSAEKEDSNKESDSDDSSGGEDIPNKKNIKTIYENLHGKYGFSAPFIAGMLGNFAVESHLDPTANEPGQFGEKSAKAATDGELGIGFAQMSFERHKALVKWAKDKHDTDWWDIEAQLDYMAQGDTMYSDILKDLAANSSDKPEQEAVKVHNDWERSADSEAKILSERGGKAKAIYEYMKKNGMDGSKDKDKIEKVGKGSKSSGKASSADTDKEEVVQNDCEDGQDEGSEETAEGLGESTKKNGKSGKTISKNYEFDELPEKYKKYVKIPKFDKKYLEGSTFPKFGDIGQCTELTWAFMNQMWKGKQPSDDGNVTNGNRVHEVYEKKGAKTTDKPTVGYGFSSDPPQAGAADPTVGHTGVVAGVMPDGKWIMASYNLPPKPAPSRTLYYTVIDGTDGGIKFFSGVGNKPKKK